ncbi:putative RNA methyltransferase [Psychrobacter urativorans]|uniref:rRNA (Guanine-N1)-methyltransferase n=1 Tax=Psychrobacter urativorans TaxID=45610 RepID=A0A0M4U4L4_9GAMM|nr:methyltransferase domain-containing protein [Psychrobacter urativorans]ALF59631.1 rRNA (guanine-N1)-methyltransferase [Psychrobacter urativorans]
MLVSLFICPICQSPLHPAADTWRCDGSLHPKQTSHPFDVARQGYVNLLPVQQKKSKAPGDSQQSIIARQRFLAAGYYQPLRDLICEQLAQLLGQDKANTDHDNSEVNWLDIGCGEGYYTQAMAQQGIIDNLIAADISKPALVELAKASKANGRLWYQQENKNEIHANKMAIYPLVTSAAHLPLRTHSMHGISSIFSPILPEIFADMLTADGYLIIAKPDIGHLMTLRESLFDSVREHDSDKFLPTLAPYFTLIATHQVTSALSLPADALADLLTMTPYAYRARAENRQALLASAETTAFNTEAKFVVYILQKTADNAHG